MGLMPTLARAVPVVVPLAGSACGGLHWHALLEAYASRAHVASVLQDDQGESSRDVIGESTRSALHAPGTAA